MLYGIYRVVSTTLLLLSSPLAAMFACISHTFRTNAAERLGVFPSSTFDSDCRHKTVWIHAASVGEIQAARVLLGELLRRLPDTRFLVTTMTVHGRDVARAQLPGEVVCRLAPLDVPCIVRKTIRRAGAAMYICLETELWPAMLTEARKAGLAMLLLNGRMSERSCRRYAMAPHFMAKLLSGFGAVGVITARDKTRYQTLGIDEKIITVTGNLKFDLRIEHPERIKHRYRAILGLDGQVVFLCGSTRTGEEELVLDVYLRLRQELTGNVLWIIAPRHLDRLKEVQTLLADHDIGYDLFSDLTTEHSGAKRRHAVVLIDTMGTLADLYAIGDFNFCGGSLVDKGGHNIMEAVRWGKPVYYGRSMRDFAEASRLLEAAGAGFKVRDNKMLYTLISRHLHNKDEYEKACMAAAQVAAMHHGAAGRQADMVLEHLPACAG